MPRPFGSDRVEELPGGLRRLRCRRPKTWVPRRLAERGLPLHPGTAVRWEDALWEVVSASELPDGGVSYDLAPWDERDAIRVLLPYDETSEAEREADRRDLGRRRGARALVLFLSPVVGLLPGCVQERLGTELGLEPTTLSLASIPAPLAAGTYALLMTLAAGFGPGLRMDGPTIGPFLPLVSVLFPESFVRVAVAVAQGRPVGSVLGVPLYLLARATGLVGPPPPTPGFRPVPGSRAGADRFLMLEPLLSLLPVADQERLRERFGFAPVTWGKRTAWFLLVYPGLTAPAQAARLALTGGSLVGGLLLLATLLLAVEQARRLLVLRRGEPAPSVLGALVRPLAVPLLDGMGPGGPTRG